MGTRGRKSAAALAVSSPVDRSSWLRPPEGLSPDEADLWADVVGAVPVDWFGGENREQLAQYCRHAVAGRDWSRVIAKALGNKATDIDTIDRLSKLRERETRAALALARSLRLTVQSRYDAATAARNRSNGSGASYYDFMGEDDAFDDR